MTGPKKAMRATYPLKFTYTETRQTMNYRSKTHQSSRRLLFALAGLSIGALPIWAQLTNTTPSAAATPAPSAEEDIIVLSPFEVDASNDNGYYSERTLARLRRRTSLRSR
jgi:hypothetical protein